MSEQLIASLQRRIDELSTQVATLNAEGKKRRIENRKLNDQLEAAGKQIEALTTERDNAKAAAEAKPGEHAKRVAELEAQLRQRDHRDAFAAVKEFTVKDDAGKDVTYTLRDGVTADAVWKQLGYVAEGERPDAAAVQGLLAGSLKDAGYLFQPKGETPDAGPGGPSTAIRTPAGRPGPGASRSYPPAGQSAVAHVDAVNGDRPAGRIA